MYDPKFEKEIQRKMEELEFRPAESVWVNIEKAVVVKRRRRVGFIWRYLLPGVFLAAAAGVYLHYDRGNTSKTTPAVAAAARTTATLHAPAASQRGSVAGDGSEGQRGSAIGDGRAKHNASGALYGSEAQHGSGARDGSGAQRESGAQHGSVTQHGSGTLDGSVGQHETEIPEAIESDPVSGTTQGAATAGHAGFVAGQKGLPQWFYLPGLAEERSTPQIKGAALTTKKSNMVALAGLARPQSRWEAGFVAGGGWSRLNRLNVDQAKAALTSYATALYSNAGASSTKRFISNTRPDASFDGGIYLQRALSDRWIFNTGMDLHYFSNRISVGEQLTTYVQASASYFIPTTAASTRTTPMYSAGNAISFTNKYYFLELPAGLQWKVSKNHLLPIFLQGGVSLSRLMGASALFYDAKTGLYSKDGDIVNKTQFNVSSALLVGLPIHGLGIQLGPMVQYGLTPLVNTQGLGDQHLLYYGLRLVVIPGRK